MRLQSKTGMRNGGEERKLAKDVERLTQLYEALLLVSHVVVQATNAKGLFDDVCRIIVDRGKFELAWIGMFDEVSKDIVPVAESGDRFDYVKAIRVSGADVPEGHGPSGISFRLNKNCITNDFLENPITKLWWDYAKKSGFRASATFPIRIKGVPVGVLNVYSNLAGYFQSKEIGLLEEAAGDISLALEKFAAEEDRRSATANLERYRAIVDSSSDSIISRDLDNNIVTWNREAERLLGWRADEIIGKSLDLIIPESRRGEFIRCQEMFRQYGSAVRELETIRVAKDGTPVRVYLIASPIFDEAGKLAGSAASLREISHRRALDEEIGRFFSSWADLLCVVNDEGYIERLSDSWTQALGWSTDELRCQPLLEFITPYDRQHFSNELQLIRCAQADGHAFDAGFQHRDDSIRILSWRASSIENG